MVLKTPLYVSVRDILNNTKTSGFPETCTVSRVSFPFVTGSFLILIDPVTASRLKKYRVTKQGEKGSLANT